MVAAGTPEAVAKNEASITGRYLASYLGLGASEVEKRLEACREAGGAICPAETTMRRYL